MADLDQLYALSIVLQVLGITLTVPQLSNEDVKGLHAALDEMQEHTGSRDATKWEMPHRRFHQLLVTHAGARLLRSTSDLADHSERYRRLYLAEPRAWTSASAEHAAIVEACEQRDAALAAHRLAKHLAGTALTLLATLSPAFEPVQIRTALRLHGFSDEDALAK
jgi:DNA-binding GntR family transcriptional regulator